MNHEPPSAPRYQMKPEAIAIAKEYWSYAPSPKNMIENNERGFNVVMAQMQIDLILCHLDKMTTEDAARAQRTLSKLYLQL